MNTSFRLPALVLGGALLAVPSVATRASAHGTMIVPESRIHRCAFDGNIENHQDPACRAAVDAGGKQALYDWNGLRQASADGRHRGEARPVIRIVRMRRPTVRKATPRNAAER